MRGFLTKLLGDPNKKALSRIQPIVDKINSFEPTIRKLSDEKLADKTLEFKKRLEKDEKLDDILPEAYAVVREAARRTVLMRHFDVQLIGGVVLHQGKIAEMKTGEGKTLVATLPLYLNALEGKGVYLVTVNDYLARRDCGWNGPIYYALGMSCSAIMHEASFMYDLNYNDESQTDPRLAHLKPISRSEAYQADITYGTNNEFGFDYLRDNMVSTLDQMVQRDPYYAIVDEVDSILIDEARTPLIISAPAEKSADLYRQFAQLVPRLKKDDDYDVDEKMEAVTLTSVGIKKMEQMLGVKNIYEESGITLVHHLEEALKAEVLFKKDRDYVVKNGEVIIVDQFTGRLMPGRRYSEGLHQAIEAKEGVKVRRESVTLATISFQNYFRMYPKLAGMTGTAVTEEEEFYKIYGLEVIVIPTYKPIIRIDSNDMIYKTEEAKFRAVIADIRERQKKGQPVLIGTIAIEKSEVLANLLEREGIRYQVLNAKFHEKEAKIIAQAGCVGVVTVATNMAGRGVDIILGGSPFDKAENENIKKSGGLHIIGTERHEARRIDNQLRGRSGRLGDPGSSQFYVSLEDDLMRIFGGDRIKSIMETLKIPEDQPIQHTLISRSIEQSQKKVEGHNFDIRKHLVEYDDVANIHRQTIYKKRRNVLEEKNIKEEIIRIIEDHIHRIISTKTASDIKDWDKKAIIDALKVFLGERHFEKLQLNFEKYNDPTVMENDIIDRVKEIYTEREKEVGSDTMRAVEKSVILRTIDTLWVEHLTAIDELREGIGLRGYGQRDPLIEYKQEAFHMFQQLLTTIDEQIANTIFRIEFAITPPQQLIRQAPSQIIMKGADEAAAAGTFADQRTEMTSSGVQQSMASEVATRERPIKTKKIGRNDPCPCGSGKKYKKCHGR